MTIAMLFGLENVMRAGFICDSNVEDGKIDGRLINNTIPVSEITTFLSSGREESHNEEDMLTILITVK